MRTINAKFVRIQPLSANVICQHEVAQAKVMRIAAFLRSGGRVPPIVAACYPHGILPLDGHHRLLAANQVGAGLDAWVIMGRSFDRLCSQVADAESHVFCGGVPAMQVASTPER